MATTQFYPINGDILDGAPYAQSDFDFSGNIVCGCASPTNSALPLVTKTATIASFTGATIYNVRRYTFQVNGVSYTKEIGVNLAFNTFAADKIQLEKALVEGSLGLEQSLVGGGVNLTVTGTGGNLVVTIQSVAGYVPQTLIVNGTSVAFA